VTQKLQLRLVITDQITGFHLGFCRLLLNYLKEAVDSQSLYVDEETEKNARTQTEYAWDLRPEVRASVSFLSEQIRYGNTGSDFLYICRLIEAAEKFLAIFEEKENGVDFDSILKTTVEHLREKGFGRPIELTDYILRFLLDKWDFVPRSPTT
jgi:hypothetical protein